MTLRREKEGGKVRQSTTNHSEKNRSTGDGRKRRQGDKHRRGGTVKTHSTYFQRDEGGGQSGHDLVCRRETECVFQGKKDNICVSTGGTSCRSFQLVTLFPFQKCVRSLSIPSSPTPPPLIHTSGESRGGQESSRGQAGNHRGHVKLHAGGGLAADSDSSGLHHLGGGDESASALYGCD